MTETQKNQIVNPANGLLIYQTNNVTGFWFFDGSTWVQAIGPAGSQGIQGTAGPGYLATSSSNVAIGTGSITFVTQSGLAYLPGDRVRVSNSGTNYVEGVVTSYSGTSLVVNADLAAGSGTYSSWNIGIAGNPGTGSSSSGSDFQFHQVLLLSASADNSGAQWTVPPGYVWKIEAIGTGSGSGSAAVMYLYLNSSVAYEYRGGYYSSSYLGPRTRYSNSAGTMWLPEGTNIGTIGNSSTDYRWLSVTEYKIVP